jgi:hypothetical protein
MLLHLIFVWSGLIQIQKRNSKSIWNSLEKIGKRIREGNSLYFPLSLSFFWPVGLSPARGPSGGARGTQLLYSCRGLPPARAARPCFILAPPWAEPAVGPLPRAPAFFPICLTHTMGSHVGAASFLKPSVMMPSKTITDQIPLNLFFP